ELDPACLQQLSQQDHKRRLARTAHRDVSDADNRSPQPPRGQQAPVIELVARSDDCSIDSGKRVHDFSAFIPVTVSTGAINFSRAARVFSVAPACERSVSAARWPRATRSGPFEMRSIRTSGSSAGPTIRMASFV